MADFKNSLPFLCFCLKSLSHMRNSCSMKIRVKSSIAIQLSSKECRSINKYRPSVLVEEKKCVGVNFMRRIFPKALTHKTTQLDYIQVYALTTTLYICSN